MSEKTPTDQEIAAAENAASKAAWKALQRLKRGKITAYSSMKIHLQAYKAADDSHNRSIETLKKKYPRGSTSYLFNVENMVLRACAMLHAPSFEEAVLDEAEVARLIGLAKAAELIALLNCGKGDLDEYVDTSGAALSDIALELLTVDDVSED